MKWSIVTGLLAAPLVLAGTLQAELVARTNGQEAAPKVEQKGEKMDKGDQNSYRNGGSTVIVEDIIVIWVNNGGGSETTTMSQMDSVSTANGAAQTQTVIVGGDAGLVYTPDTVEAAVGDMIIFTFMSQNHTATQSAFTTPCEPLLGGMNSGFMPNPNNTVNPPPQMAMQVKVSTPIWFYCAQKGHCGKGMTFSINPTANKTQAMFKEMAIAQNGTGTTAGIVATGAPQAATTMATVAVTAPTDASPPPSQQTATSNYGSGYSSGSMSQGTGSIGSDGECSCSCLCGVTSFPSAVQGLEGFGGMSGGMPMAAAMKS